MIIYLRSEVKRRVREFDFFGGCHRCVRYDGRCERCDRGWRSAGRPKNCKKVIKRHASLDDQHGSDGTANELGQQGPRASSLTYLLQLRRGFDCN